MIEGGLEPRKPADTVSGHRTTVEVWRLSDVW